MVQSAPGIVFARKVAVFPFPVGVVTDTISRNRSWPLPFSQDELLFLRMLEGWQGMPRYQLVTVAIGE